MSKNKLRAYGVASVGFFSFSRDIMMLFDSSVVIYYGSSSDGGTSSISAINMR